MDKRVQRLPDAETVWDEVVWAFPAPIIRGGGDTVLVLSSREVCGSGGHLQYPYRDAILGGMKRYRPSDTGGHGILVTRKDLDSLDEIVCRLRHTIEEDISSGTGRPILYVDIGSDPDAPTAHCVTAPQVLEGIHALCDEAYAKEVTSVVLLPLTQKDQESLLNSGGLKLDMIWHPYNTLWLRASKIILVLDSGIQALDTEAFRRRLVDIRRDLGWTRNY